MKQINTTLRNILLHPRSISIFLSNLLPLYGVLFLNWQVSQIVMIYWLETVVIVLYIFPKIVIKTGVIDINQLLGIFAQYAVGLYFMYYFLAAFFHIHSFLNKYTLVTLFYFLITHGITFYFSCMKTHGNKKESLKDINTFIMKRLAYLNFALFAIAYVISYLGSPQPAIVALVIYKIVHETSFFKFFTKEYTSTITLP